VRDARRPELLDIGALDARDFLASLDVFVFRKHPHIFETGGTVILEAMAMQLPVIVFSGDCGYAEIIKDGENGFIVANEAEALVCVERLQADLDLRTRLGAAARATVVALMYAQESAMLGYYLGSAAHDASTAGATSMFDAKNFSAGAERDGHA
jgi:glycosyltransferase involved in cell wall biosynthesis